MFNRSASLSLHNPYDALDVCQFYVNNHPVELVITSALCGHIIASAFADDDDFIRSWNSLNDEVNNMTYTSYKLHKSGLDFSYVR